ncbi:hypothetical protein ACF0H5_015167 [Mactra antiquata]
MEHLNGGPPVQGRQGIVGNRSMVAPSSGSSFSVLSNHTGSQINNGYIHAVPPVGAGSTTDMSSDIPLEQAMEKVQELATENSTLREFLKENNENMKRQFQMLLQWKDKVRESNKQNLIRFEQLHREINILKMENEKYKQCIDSPDKKSTVLQELQQHIRKLEAEKIQYEQELTDLRKKVGDLKQQLDNRSPDRDMVYVNSSSDPNELDGYKKRCAELANQVHNFHQQNEQLMQDLQQLNTLKLKMQSENTALNEQNLALQKKLQGLFGDINKTKYSVGALQGTDNEATSVKEAENVSKSDMELLELQTAATQKQNSLEEYVSSVADELKEKLHLEKERSCKQKQQLSSKEIEISRLQSQLSEKDQMLGHYKEQLDSQIAHITQEHKRQQQDLIQQLDMLNSELHRTKSSLPYQGDVQNLKSQVMTLIKESQELSSKLEISSKQLEKKSVRIVELEQHLCRREEEFTQSRREADSIIQQLRYSLSTAEDTVVRERGQHATTKNQMLEVRNAFSQLVNDYKELLDTFDTYKAQHEKTQQQSGTPNKQMMDEINRLTAQTIAAEEAITYRDDQIKQLKHEIAQLKDEINNTVPVLKAQAELWKQDFDAERYARERQVAEKESILQEMKNLELKNQQLMDELDNYSRQSLVEMQRRHAAPMYQQQLQNRLQGNQQQGMYPQQQPAANQFPQHQGALGGNQGQQMSPRNQIQPRQQQQQVSPRQHGGNVGIYNTQQPMEHGGDDNIAGHQEIQPVPVQFQQPQSHGSSNNQEEGDNQLTCPKCGITCPDLDSLQVHVLDCID